MSVNKANGLLKILVPTGIALMVFGVVAALKGGSSPEISTTPSDVIYDLSDEEQKDLGLTVGDTPHDTLKTLVGVVKEVRADVERANSENERLRRENEMLKGNSEEVERRIEQAVESKQNELVSAFEQRLRELTGDIDSRIGQLTGQPTEIVSDIPIGNGTSPLGFGTEGGSSPMQRGNVDSHGVKWIKPDDVILRDASGKVTTDEARGTPSFSNPFKTLDDSVLGKTIQDFTGKESAFTDKPKKTKYYTIPENSTLMGSVSMTALLGRVPINGTVSDPYPFKILIGRENLMANGIDLPDIEGAIVSGSASGDWTLSCVRGEIKSMTFVFADGRIVNARDRAESNGSHSDSRTIGWLSNPEGVPCVPGERKTNAPEYLASQFLLSGAEAAAQNFAMGQTTTVVDGGNVVNAVTGNQGKFVLGQAIGGGLRETSNWFRQRYGQTFDAVYVPPGKAIAAHISTMIEIDYDATSRKVKYRRANHSSQMD